MSQFSTFGPLLRYLRKRAGMTQGDLAAAVGYSVSYISALEKEQRRPDSQQVAERFLPALAGAGEPRLLDRLLELAGPVESSPPVQLLGRAAELAQITHLVMSHPGRLVTLTGPPGIGKTSLALAAAQRLAPLHADGVTVVWLGAIESIELVAPALTSALGLVENEQPAAARLVAHLRRRELLLVLDNFEQVMAAASLVTELLAACPRLRVLVTSRERLRLRAEQSIPLRPLDNATAVELFVARVRARDAHYELAADAHATVAALCRQLDELPLAIELMAAHALTNSPAALLAQLRDRQGGGPPADQPVLTTALQRSYLLLTAEEQRLLRMLGVFAGGVSLDALAWLGRDLRTVQALANKSLLRLARAGDDRRIVMLETVRDFALARLQAADELHAAQDARLAWCVALAEQAEPLLHSAAQTAWLQRLEPERYNFYGALHYDLGAGGLATVAAAVRLASSLRHFWVARNHVAEIACWLEAIHAAAEQVGLDAHLWVRLCNCAGTIAFYRAEYAAAHRHFAAALSRAEAIGDRQGVAYALDGLGAEAVNRGDLSGARVCSAASLEHSTAIGDHWLAGITLMNLGEIARMEDDLAAADRHYRASLARLQLAGDPFFTAVAQINLGQVCLHRNDLSQAESALRQALAAGLQAESVQIVAPALEKLAGVLSAREPASARRCFGLAQGLRQASGVAVQPVDEADHARLAASLPPAGPSAEEQADFTVSAPLDWEAVRALVRASG